METPGGSTKSKAITREQWGGVFEAMAWAGVAAFAMLLLQARQVDRWDTEGRLGILVVVLLFGVAMTYLRAVLFSQSRRFKSVEAECFVLKQDGIVLAKLGREENWPAPSLELYNSSGFPAARLGHDNQDLEIALSLYDWSGKEQVRLSPGPIFPRDSGARTLLAEDGMALYDGDGTEKLSIGLDDGEPNILLSGAAGQSPSVRLTVEDGNPKISLFDKEEKERIAIEVIDSATRLSLASKNAVLCFLDDKGDKQAIQISDTKGRVIWSAP